MPSFGMLLDLHNTGRHPLLFLVSMSSYIGALLMCALAALLVKLIVETLVLSSCEYLSTTTPEVVEGLRGLPSVVGAVNFIEENGKEQILIPRLIHQTYKTHDLPDRTRWMVDTWEHRNPGWEMRFYNDTECLDLVKSNFPQYLDAYVSLPKNVERADFFRYMVVLKFGGFYADTDTECKRPLNKVIRSLDKMVVGWELEFKTGVQAAKRSYARRRQILQWAFGAVPGHPALVEACDWIAKNAEVQFSNHADRDTLERTGPGMFTDVVLRHAANPAAGVRVLPRVAFGVNPLGDDGLNDMSPGISVQHHFAGSWKQKPEEEHREKDSGTHFVSRKAKSPWLNLSRHVNQKDVKRPVENLSKALYPVGVPWEPSFVIMVYRKGHGEDASGSDVGADLTTWGNWQAGMDPTQAPRVIDLVLGLIDSDKDLGLIDIGAGLGFFAVAAASRGHPVLAFEPRDKNLVAFRETVEYNELNHLVRIIHGLPEGHGCHGEKRRMPSLLPGFGGNSVRHRQDNKGDSLSSSGVRIPEIFNFRSTTGVKIGGFRIGVTAAVKTSAIIRAALDFLSRERPKVILIEFMPFVMETCRSENPSEVLTLLQSIGYNVVYHAGEVCKRQKLQRGSLSCHRHRHDRSPEGANQHVWCYLQPKDFKKLATSAPSGWPENLVFMHRDEFEQDS